MQVSVDAVTIRAARGLPLVSAARADACTADEDAQLSPCWLHSE